MYWGDAQHLSAGPGNPSWEVIAGDFSLAANPASLTMPRGTYRTSTITATAVGSFSTPLTLNCSPPLPQYASCSFSPVTANWSGGTATSILTIDTAEPSTAKLRHSVTYLAIFTFGLPGLLLLGNRKRLSKRTLVATLLLMAAITMMLGLGACGSTPNRTPAGTYSITVTVSGGTTNHSLPLTVVVTQ